VKLKDVPYECDFYWKGDRYRQFVRPKKSNGAFKVTCYQPPQGECVDMPSGRDVKPIVRAIAVLDRG
jgi:hypothetical protein